MLQLTVLHVSHYCITYTIAFSPLFILHPLCHSLASFSLFQILQTYSSNHSPLFPNPFLSPLCTSIFFYLCFCLFELRPHLPRLTPLSLSPRPFLIPFSHHHLHHHTADVLLLNSFIFRPYFSVLALPISKLLPRNTSLPLTQTHSFIFIYLPVSATGGGKR